MKNRWIALLLALALILTAASVGCAETNGKHINAALYWFGTNLDPTSEYNGWTVCRAGIGETLVYIDESMQIVGQIADSWEMVDENTWSFHIRPGVLFHNGEACDAEAVKTSFERVLGDVERARTSSYISEIAVDGENIIFTSSQPNASFLNAISEPLFTVEYVGDGVDYENAPICTGPFMVTGFEADVEIQTAAFADYWDGASDVATMTILNVTDDSTRALALQSGELDIVQRVSSADLPLFTDNPDFKVADTAGIRTRTLQFNYENEVLSDINVRKALAACLDYDALARVLGNDVTAAGLPYPQELYGFGTVEGQHYDPETAAACLAQSGWADSDGDGIVEKDGKPLELTIVYNVATMTAVNEAIQDMARQVGIQINLSLVENLDDIEINGQFEIKEANVQYLSTGDPAWMLVSIFQSASGTNYGHYNNAELDALVDQISECFDPAEKVELVKQAQQILLDDAAGVFLMAQSNIVAAKAGVDGITAHPIDYYFITNKLTINE